MSRAKRSAPTPTVKTGIERALMLASDSSSAASEVSAPSLTITRPASGRPESSSRARASAWPRCVDVPAYFMPPADWTRSVDAEKRKKRSTKRSESALSSGLSALREVAADELAARLALPIRDLHAARVVHQDAEEILLRDRRLEDQRGPEETEQDDGERGEAQGDEDGAVARRGAADAAVGDERVRRHDAGDENRGDHRPRRAEHEVALLEDQRPVFEQESKESFKHSGRF